MAFGVELSGQKNLCSEASGEFALALKRTIGGITFAIHISYRVCLTFLLMIRGCLIVLFLPF